MTKGTSLRFEPMGWQQLMLAIGIMILIVVSSNVLVQYPINNWLTWGAVTYPIAFLVADVLNRRFGPSAARRVAYVGFVAALIISAWLASPRIDRKSTRLNSSHVAISYTVFCLKNK